MVRGDAVAQRPDTGGPGRARFSRADYLLLGGSVAAVVVTFALRTAGLAETAVFVLSAVALALLARVVGRGVGALGDRLGPSLTGIVQSALGNLPELFVSLFALRAGLVGVVQSAIVGSILANVLLVLGLAFLVGGLRHGRLTFAAGTARIIGLMLLLSVAALLVPALTAELHSPAAGHENLLSRIVSGVLLVLFALSLFAPALREPPAGGEAERPAEWPVAAALAVLTAGGVAAAFVSDWFVEGLQPAMTALHISQAFAGLVIVAIAGNAVENVVGIQLAAQGRTDYALSVILQSPLQIALVLAPVIVLAAPLMGASFTLVLPPLLIAVLVIAVVIVVLVVLDGEGTWFEGAALIALYAIIAAAFWWG
ncbi:sodium:proton exchanger [Amycolatopsis granulosa]|uniref:sodium:proton exchanger n=1 Tax=Amycolatopsis granulosa TaxID=185684 RepID=UPI001422CD32|nr:sodium:proton exchanger [Amycolatopsis granulosa]NIH83304.1 Ca2+:H+ antiporter [Amycolatopsis granulosa]